MFLTTKALRIIEGIMLAALVSVEITSSVIVHKMKVAAIKEQQKVFKQSVEETNAKMMKDANEVAEITKDLKEQAEESMKDLKVAKTKKVQQGVA